ncbi:MAG: DUF2752 domain-containing protein [Bacteroides sp.]|nr:DUF2752 domain-containing protein [Roseburia sp.]MCM1347035.1 DUF2752 domain-containing protein [Bacteroides sp.]MCM1420724.1 DUF2752 domain-containing protein [Bacteroides sp.]
MRTVLRTFLITLSLVIAVWLYYTYNPAASVWSPKCVMLALTGYRCPGCGIQRLVHHVLHGNIAEGLRYNYFAAGVVLYVFVAGLGLAVRKPSCRFFVRKYLVSRYAAYTYMFLYVVWWVVRNIVDL